MIKLGRRSRKFLWKFVLIAFLVLNILSFCGAYAMTHFSAPGQFGFGLPRPTSAKLPTDVGLDYVTQRIPLSSTEWLETWFIPAQSAELRGTVLLFPGNGGSKARQLLAPTQVFHSLGYDTLLVDFRGVGGSSGNTTTLGVREAKDISAAIDDAQRENLKRPLILYGVSMGSAAILNAVANENVNPDAIILELPFARLVDAVRSRLRAVRIPTFPLAEMVVFWGSIQHGFNGFAHNPVTYARRITCPALLLHGKLDKWTTMEEINQIFQNFQGPKELAIFPNTGHTLLVTVDKEFWKQSVDQFLKDH